MRLEMVAEALGSIAPLDVCLLDTMELDELEQPWPDYVRDAEHYRVEVDPGWARKVAAGRAGPVREARLATAARTGIRARFFEPAPALTWCVEARGYEPVADLVRSPVVLDLHNLHSSLATSKRRLLVRRPWDRELRGLAAGVDYVPGLVRAWSRWEQAVAARCDRVALCSDLDRGRLGTANAVTIPNCYRRPDAPAGRRPRSAERPFRVGFVGMLDYQPNADAVTWFVDAVLPRLQAAAPGAELVVIGRHSELLGGISARPGVRCTGFVPDLAAALAEVDAIVAPLRVGGGTRFKILEGFAHELPVVSTTLGAEGIDAVDGRHLLLRDDAPGFADALVRLARDPQLRSRLVDEASRLYQERYTWERGVAAVRSLATELLAAHA
jgi:glycosyltransferase involved in cell wall biosynthesis